MTGNTAVEAFLGFARISCSRFESDLTNTFADTVKMRQVKENANEHLLTPLDTSSFNLLLHSLLLPYDVCQSVFHVIQHVHVYNEIMYILFEK